LAPFIGSAGWQAALGRNFALGCVGMGPKSKVETEALRKAGASNLKMPTFGTTARLRLQVTMIKCYLRPKDSGSGSTELDGAAAGHHHDQALLPQDSGSGSTELDGAAAGHHQDQTRHRQAHRRSGRRRRKTPRNKRGGQARKTKRKRQVHSAYRK
jgi:hypothetical protein